MRDLCVISAIAALLVRCAQPAPAPTPENRAPAEVAAPKVEPAPQPVLTIEALIERIKSSNGKDNEAIAAFKQQVTHEHIPLVIDQLNVSYPGWDPILVDALEHIVTPEDKALIVEKYKTKISLIDVIRLHHWERDVKDTLVEQIDRNTGYVPIPCLEALADLKDPSTYPALKSYFIHGWNRHQTYNVISLLPGMELSKELPLAWEKAISTSNKYEAAYLIGPVLDLGYAPAMDFVMEQLRTPSDIPVTILDPDILSMRYLDHGGDKQERLRYWDENKKKLRFDAASKKFTTSK